jgi:hypothetical protein
MTIGIGAVSPASLAHWMLIQPLLWSGQRVSDKSSRRTFVRSRTLTDRPRHLANVCQQQHHTPGLKPDFVFLIGPCAVLGQNGTANASHPDYMISAHSTRHALFCTRCPRRWVGVLPGCFLCLRRVGQIDLRRKLLAVRVPFDGPNRRQSGKTEPGNQILGLAPILE